MAAIGLMLEGQEDLTWDRFIRLVDAAEALGFEALFRSDHLTALENFPKRESLELWTSLAVAAQRTRRLRFGPLVCPLTFHHPFHLARRAASLDQLSDGRFELGIGAGWFAAEHWRFGFAFPPMAERLERLEEGARAITALWTGQPVTHEGQYYPLEDAEIYPQPVQTPMPLIVGGKGERTLRLVAEYASEWNCSYAGVDSFRRLSILLDEQCDAAGRDPLGLRRSVMIPFVIGRTPTEIQGRIDAHRAMFPSLPTDLEDWLMEGYIGGTPSAVVDQLSVFLAAGAQRFMLQHNDLDDIASLELLAHKVLPQFT
jgi:alkanesulfonate monooxygenase SsuD/methylene tetrahydromethanopterin reductase-like flavin-dependent oxidoreductase (luciferase family)